MRRGAVRADDALRGALKVQCGEDGGGPLCVDAVVARLGVCGTAEGGLVWPVAGGGYGHVARDESLAGR